jgi:hypothetical protein
MNDRPPSNLFAKIGDEVVGPIDAWELRKMVSAGRLHRSDHVRRDKGPWCAADSVKGLFPDLESVPVAESPEVPGTSPCPYCNREIKPKSRKCPECKNAIRTKNGKMLTSDQWLIAERDEVAERMKVLKRSNLDSISQAQEMGAKKIEYIGTHDTHTCDRCLDLDGKKKLISKLTSADIPPFGDCQSPKGCRIVICAAID